MKNEISFQLDPAREVTTQADFTYKITPHTCDSTITITDTGKGKLSVANDIEAVLRKIEFWHQGSIASFKITYGMSMEHVRLSGGTVNEHPFNEVRHVSRHVGKSPWILPQSSDEQLVNF
jgi:hypothetical protein